MFYLGCAIWAYKEWVGDLFPAGSKSADFLRLYSRRLTTVEGNTTFYATPKPDVVARWAAETPETFRFCLKLPREVSHSGSLERQLATTQAFVERMAPLGARLGPFFLQLPPTYGPVQRRDLARWLAAWPADQRIAIEVRHPDWYTPVGEPALQEILSTHQAGRVIMDVRPIRRDPSETNSFLATARERKPDVPMHPLRSSTFSLVRYIGHPDLANNHDLLAEWAQRTAQWLADDHDVYWFAHCPDEARSPAIARAFHQHLAAHTALPPLTWPVAEPPPASPTQLELF